MDKYDARSIVNVGGQKLADCDYGAPGPESAPNARNSVLCKLEESPTHGHHNDHTRSQARFTAADQASREKRFLQAQRGSDKECVP